MTLDLADYMSERGITSNERKEPKDPKLVETMDAALDRKKRANISKPSQQRSKAQSNMKDAWPSPDDVAKFMDGQA